MYIAPHQFFFSIFLALPLIHVSFLIFTSPKYSIFSYPLQSKPMFHFHTQHLVSSSVVYLNFNCLTHGCMPKYLPSTVKHLLPAAILDFISSLITFFGFFKAHKYLKFWTPSNIYPFIIRYCSKFVIFLFSFIYFVLLSFITNLVLTAASLICVTTSLIALNHVPYQHIICICLYTVSFC